MKKTAISSLATKVFEKSVDDYHVYDDINRLASNPYDKKDFESESDYDDDFLI